MSANSRLSEVRRRDKVNPVQQNSQRPESVKAIGCQPHPDVLVSLVKAHPSAHSYGFDKPTVYEIPVCLIPFEEYVSPIVIRHPDVCVASNNDLLHVATNKDYIWKTDLVNQIVDGDDSFVRYNRVVEGVPISRDTMPYRLEGEVPSLFQHPEFRKPS